MGKDGFIVQTGGPNCLQKPRIELNPPPGRREHFNAERVSLLIAPRKLYCCAASIRMVLNPVKVFDNPEASGFEWFV